MRSRFVWIFAALILVLSLAACGGSEFECPDEWGCAEIGPGQSVKVGYVGPTTGDYSAFGIDITRGAALAVADHPKIKGFEVELVVEDTQGANEQGAAVANKLASDPRVIGIDGHTFSGATEVAIPIYEDAGIVMVSPSATDPTLMDLESAIFNRVAFTDRMQGEFAARYLYEELGVTKIALMHDGGTYGQGLAEAVGRFFEEMGGEVVAKEGITPGETDYSAPLAAVAAMEPELVYYGGYDADAAVLVTQMEGAGLGDVPFFGCDGTYGAKYLDLAGEAAEGSYSTYVPIPESEAFSKFRADYKESYGDEQGELSPFSPHGYDAMTLILEAAEKVAIQEGDSLYIPRQALAEAVRNTEGYQGLTGSITCSETGECAAASILFMVVKDGEWVPAPGQ